VELEQSRWFRSIGTPEWPGNHLKEVCRERTFPISPADALGVVADAVHSGAHFLLSQRREDDATIARRTQRAYLAERIELRFVPGVDEGSTVIHAMFRPLSVMSAGVDGRRELEHLFAGEPVAQQADSASTAGHADGRPVGADSAC
jgi:hypothetical protein